MQLLRDGLTDSWANYQMLLFQAGSLCQIAIIKTDAEILSATVLINTAYMNFCLGNIGEFFSFATYDSKCNLQA